MCRNKDICDGCKRVINRGRLIIKGNKMFCRICFDKYSKAKMPGLKEIQTDERRLKENGRTKRTEDRDRDN